MNRLTKLLHIAFGHCCLHGTEGVHVEPDGHGEFGTSFTLHHERKCCKCDTTWWLSDYFERMDRVDWTKIRGASNTRKLQIYYP